MPKPIPKEYKKAKQVMRTLLVDRCIDLLEYLNKTYEFCERESTRTDIKSIQLRFRFKKTKLYRLIKILFTNGIINSFYHRGSEFFGKYRLKLYKLTPLGESLLRVIRGIESRFPTPPIRLKKEYDKPVNVKDLPIDILFE